MNRCRSFASGASVVLWAILLWSCALRPEPESASYYKALYEECQKQKTNTETYLEDCLEKGEYLRRELN